MSETQNNVAGIGGTMMARFESTLSSCRFVFAGGKVANFINNEYFTNNEEEVKELMGEVQAGHPHIFINKDKFVVETKFVDPVEAIRARLMDELKAQGRLIAAGDSDFGTSDQQMKLTVGNTKTVAEAMSGSNSSDGAAATAGATTTAAPVAATATINLGALKIGPRTA